MAIEVQLAATPEAWELDDPAAMFTAATELAERGWRGGLEWNRQVVAGETTGPIAWEMTLNSDLSVAPEVKAHLGDRLLLAGGVLQRLTPEEWAGVTA